MNDDDYADDNDMMSIRWRDGIFLFVDGILGKSLEKMQNWKFENKRDSFESVYKKENKKKK